MDVVGGGAHPGSIGPRTLPFKQCSTGCSGSSRADTPLTRRCPLLYLRARSPRCECDAAIQRGIRASRTPARHRPAPAQLCDAPGCRLPGAVAWWHLPRPSSIAVAVRGRATFFAVAVWAAAAAVIAALIVAATLRARRRWLSVEQAVRLADRRAALDDRLATLLLDPARARDSRLRDILLEQILAATPRWDVDTLAPRRVPRSLYALLAALVSPRCNQLSGATARHPATNRHRHATPTDRRPHSRRRAAPGPSWIASGRWRGIAEPGRTEQRGESAERVAGTGSREGPSPETGRQGWRTTDGQVGNAAGEPPAPGGIGTGSGPERRA